MTFDQTHFSTETAVTPDPYKQIIIARKDLNMSPGKLAAQVSHGSMAFLSTLVKGNARKFDPTEYRTYGKRSKYYNEPVAHDTGVLLYRHPDLWRFANEAHERGESTFHCKPKDPVVPYGELVPCEPEPQYRTEFTLDCGTMEGWLMGSFTKVILGAKNKSQLEKGIRVAEELGLEEGRDFFLIKDNCLTELEPEEKDPSSPTGGRTLTVVGFRPLEAEVAHKISKKFQLYR